MKNILILQLAIILYSCTGMRSIIAEKVNQERIVNGNVSKEGYWLEQFDSASIIIVKYVKNMKEGKAKVIYNDGGYCILKFKNNKKNGTAKYFSKKGMVYLIEEFKDDIKVNETRYSPKW